MGEVAAGDLKDAGGGGEFGGFAGASEQEGFAQESAEGAEGGGAGRVEERVAEEHGGGFVGAVERAALAIGGLGVVGIDRVAAAQFGAAGDGFGGAGRGF